MSLPHRKVPCKDCPFRTDCRAGWLGKKRMSDILNRDSFTCHKTNDPNRLQCAGHMVIKGEQNAFVSLAAKLRIDLDLRGRELVFQAEQDLINHHA